MTTDSLTKPDPYLNENVSREDDLHEQDRSTVTANSQALRWWPAAVLVAVMLVMPKVPSWFESPSLPVMMFGLVGPAFVGVLVLLWWCAFSRAGAKERIVGIIGFLVIAVAMLACIDDSLQGMGLPIVVIPTGVVGFAISLVLLSHQPKWRVPVALLVTFLGYGFWNLKQSEGFTGTFETQLRWRWEPTAEEAYLSGLELASSKKLDSASNSASNTEPLESDLPSMTIGLAESQWPAFRGADRTGVISDLRLDSDWKSSPPKEVWRSRIGPGWSSFSVAAGRLFTQEQRGENEAVVCLDADTGEAIWDMVYPSRFWEAIGGAGPRATPTIADEGLFCLGANGILVCLDAVDGTERWRRDLRVDAKREPPPWGFSSSPLVTDSVVIVHAGGKEDRGLFAYGTDDGEVVWSIESGDHCYSSAQSATFDSVDGVLMMSNLGLQFVNAATGEAIWTYDWSVENYRALQPLVIDQSILIATSLGLGTRRVSVTREEDGNWKVVEDWETRGIKPEFNDYVFYEGFVYGFDGNIFGCVDAATGERQWKRGRYGNGQVLLLADAGQLLVLSEEGELVLVDASPERLGEAARFQAIQGKTWNHPVLIGSRLYVRNAEEAACFELSLANDTTSTP